MADEDTLLTTVDLAQRWGVHPGSVSNMRHFRTGPPFVKRGSRAVRYRLSDVRAYEAAQQITPIKNVRGSRRSEQSAT